MSKKKEISANADQPVKGVNGIFLNAKSYSKEDSISPSKIETCVLIAGGRADKSEIVAMLEDADKALLAGKHAVAHSCIRLAITELTGES